MQGYHFQEIYTMAKSKVERTLQIRAIIVTAIFRRNAGMLSCPIALFTLREWISFSSYGFRLIDREKRMDKCLERWGFHYRGFYQQAFSRCTEKSIIKMNYRFRIILLVYYFWLLVITKYGLKYLPSFFTLCLLLLRILVKQHFWKRSIVLLSLFKSLQKIFFLNYFLIKTEIWIWSVVCEYQLVFVWLCMVFLVILVCGIFFSGEYAYQ